MQAGSGYWLLVIGCWGLVTGVVYTLLIGFFTMGWYRSRRSAVTGRRSVVSVIIAVRNEEEFIQDLLNDLQVQDYSQEITEIIIVDDHSVDRTAELVNEFIMKEMASRFRLLRFDDPVVDGKKAAISYGVRHTSGDIILTTDADCRLGDRWISSLMASFHDEKIKMVFGPVTYFKGKRFSDDFQSMEFAGLVASGAGAALNGHPFLCNGANLAYRKDAFLEVNGFGGNEKYLSGDDVFLLHKMKKTFGRKSIVFCKDKQAMVQTYPTPGFRKFINQRTRWASKSKGYKDGLSILTAIIVFSYSLIVLLSFLAGFFNPVYFLAAGGLLLVKMIADFPLMLGITRFTGQLRLMGWYVPFQVVYPVYIVVAGMLSLFGRKRW